MAHLVRRQLIGTGKDPLLPLRRQGLDDAEPPFERVPDKPSQAAARTGSWRSTMTSCARNAAKA